MPVSPDTDRPDENHALRVMTLEGLEAVLEHCRNALLKAEDDEDERTMQVYRRQRDRAAAELLARRQERNDRDSQAQATGEWPEIEP